MRLHLLGSSLPDAPAYGGNTIYLFSTLDDPAEKSQRAPSQILSPNSKHQKTGDNSSARPDDPMIGDASSVADNLAPSDREDMKMDESGDREEMEEDGEEEEEEEEDGAETKYSEVPLVLPRRSYKGLANLRTIKDGAVFTGRRETSITEDGNPLQSTLSDPMTSLSSPVLTMVTSSCGEEKQGPCTEYTRATGAL